METSMAKAQALILTLLDLCGAEACVDLKLRHGGRKFSG